MTNGPMNWKEARAYLNAGGKITRQGWQRRDYVRMNDDGELVNYCGDNIDDIGKRFDYLGPWYAWPMQFIFSPQRRR